MKHSRILISALSLAIVSSVGGARAQTLVDADSFRAAKQGLHFYNVTASSGYSSMMDFGTDAARSGSSAQLLGGSYFTAASVTVGYSYGGPSYMLSLRYMPAYSGRYMSSNLNSFNHDFSIQLSKRLGSHWSSYFGGSTTYSTIEQFIFSPSALSTFVDGTGTVDDLAGNAMAGGLARPLSPESPTQVLIYGSRVLFLGGNAGATYRPSSRLSFSFNGSLGESKARQNSSDSGVAPSLVQSNQSEQGNALVSYGLNVRTEIGGQVSATRIRSAGADYQSTTVTGSIGRKLGMRWFGSVQGGFGTYTSLGVVERTLPGSVSYVANGVLGFRGREHTLAGVYSRTIADQYGLGSSATTGLTAAWKWRRPGQSWSFDASGGKQFLSGSILGDLETWQATAGLSRELGRQVSVNVSYAYLTQAITPLAIAARLSNDINIHAVRLTITWIPLLRETAPRIAGAGAGRGNER